MRTLLVSPLLLALLPLLVAAPVGEPDVRDTRLVSQPAISAKHIAFVYAEDLWVADRDGGNVRRLTSDTGVESLPVFSPDGKTIAFTAEYDGNLDVYTIPVEGGAVKRLTWHPGPDLVRGFTPDGKSVLFASPRNASNGRHTQLYTVPLTGGMPVQLPIPYGADASYSPDGSHIAYTPLGDRTQQWKHYRGGTHSRIWVYRCKDHAVTQIPQPEGRCNDLRPCWVGETVYFLSDRAGEYNLFAYDVGTKKVRQLTKYDDFPVLGLAANGESLLLEQAGYLHLFSTGEGTAKRLKVGVASDLVDARPRYAKGAKYVRAAALSPSGARAVFEFRGEIVTVPAAKCDPRNLTRSTGVHERAPAWSPDGKSVAYFSDEGGEYQLHLRPADGKGEAKKYALQGGAGFYERLTWAPDSKKLAFVDNSQSLFWIDLDSGKVKKIASEPHYGPSSLVQLRPAWSPDSKWILYALGNKAAFRTVHAYELATGKARPITDGLSDAIDPVFDVGGKYLYFLASTDAGPANQWFAQSNADMRVRRTPYLVVLQKGIPSPLARQSDEEKPAEKKDKKKDKDKDKANDKPVTVAIDFDGIENRTLAMPIPAADYTQLRVGTTGQIHYREWAPAPPRATGPRSAVLRRFDLSKRKSEEVLKGVIAYSTLSADASKSLVMLPGDNWAIVELDKPDVEKGKLKLDAVEVRVAPRDEWPQIFDEAWRINRDYFYDPGMHGADWKAIRKKYEAFLPHLSCRGDLDRVIRWMLSELAVGHSYLSPGERRHERKSVPGGLLGADYEIHEGRYRFRKVYGGLNWSPELRSPLTAPGVDVKAGEYLLAVRGTELKPPTEVYSLFENTSEKSIEITVGPSADGKGSRTVTVEPLGDEGAIRNRDWVEGNLRKVHKATAGRVAYVYVPNTAGLGHEYFKRYFFPQTDRDAIIVDERFNGGGQVADYYIDHLRRPFTAMWATRHGEDFKTPGGAIFGPKVMLIDETAGSGGDLLPWMFRQNKLGPLVGKRTWGGLVGILGFPVLMDGGGVTAPNLAFWTAAGFGVENEGVPPDVVVEQWPADVIAGRDPQLEKAIEIVLQKLKESPPLRLKRPPFPVRVKR